MDIGTSKCIVVSISKGKVVDSGDILLQSGEVISQLSPSEAYKYLGIMECNTVKNQLMKTRLTKEYKRRVRKLLPTKLLSKNIILAINVYYVSLLRYSGGLVQWTQSELYNVDVMTRKHLTMHGGF